MSTSGWDATASPTCGPVPQTRLNTPSGRPASAAASAKMNELSGAISLPLRTTVQPAAMAAPAFMQIIFSGAFHGVIAPITPAGSRRTTVFPIRSSQSMSPRASAAMSRSAIAVPTWARAAIDAGWPTSLTIVWRISPDLASSRRASFVTTSARSSGDDCDQLAKASAAACAARSTSSADPPGTVAIGSSVAGSITVMTSVPDEGSHLPLTKISWRSITRTSCDRIYELLFLFRLMV